MTTMNNALAAEVSTSADHARDLFLVGFLVLFLELACIRWFSAYVVFLQFFTNVILLAAFLGMSCGCLAARAKRDWLKLFPLIALVTILAALGTLEGFKHWQDIVVDVGAQRGSPQEVFFGTEYRDPDVAKFVVPIDAIAGVFFILVALMFVGLGQVLGRAFDAYPDRVKAYTYNIGGSLAGIVGFSLLSFMNAPPVLWFAITLGGIGTMLYRARTLSLLGGACMVALLVAVTAVLPTISPREDYWRHDIRWSPYYAVDHEGGHREILVNTVGHQVMIPFQESGSFYSIIHLLRRHSGGAPFGDVMVIGAGSGNDLAHALKFGAKHIDAVEIDPVIQATGIAAHPDKPYQDPRVERHLDDGRHFLRTTNKTYDLVVYALVDSLMLHSGYANLRLESYLFTEQALADAARVLKPGGVFVSYNYFRQGWIVERITAMATKAFGCPATVISLPYREVVTEATAGGFSMIIGGCDANIVKAFAEKGPLWLNTQPPNNMNVDGFSVDPATAPSSEGATWEKIAPSKVADTSPTQITDDWPFLYLKDRVIPSLNLRSMALIGVLGLGLLVSFMPRRQMRLDGTMFFLGAAFMLLETKAVVQLALLFGSTWIVNSAVFFTVLVLILFANLFVLKVQNVGRIWPYAGLIVLMGANFLIPTEAFLGGSIVTRYILPCVLALGPMFFAGIVFATRFRDSADPDLAFGSNIAGSVIGGLAEAFSTLLGFKYLLLIAIAFYLLSAVFPKAAPRLNAP